MSHFAKALENSADYRCIPETTLYTLEAYLMQGQTPGGFVRAVLENDLFAAVSRADLDNQRALVSIVKLVSNHMPMGCHGSPGAVNTWLEAMRETEEGDGA